MSGKERKCFFFQGYRENVSRLVVIIKKNILLCSTFSEGSGTVLSSVRFNANRIIKASHRNNSAAKHGKLVIVHAMSVVLNDDYPCLDFVVLYELFM